MNEPWDYEHPLPQWLHKFAGDAAERKSSAVLTTEGAEYTWRQLCLGSHRNCNHLFAKYVEGPARNAVKTIVDGGTVTSTQIDAVLDWLDKVRSASAHMGVAFAGHGTVMNYRQHDFPNWRIGSSDRTASFFRVKGGEGQLDLWECMSEAFVSSPSSIVLRIKDLVIVSASNNMMLSQAFGLDEGRLIDGRQVFEVGNGIYAPGFGSRITRIPMAYTVAQPMRRHYVNHGVQSASPSISKNGDGHVYHLKAGRWNRTRTLDFSQLPTLAINLGYALAALEACEWTILTKEQDHYRQGSPEKFFAMNSMPALRIDQNDLIEFISHLRNGLRPASSDRTTLR